MMLDKRLVEAIISAFSVFTSIVRVGGSMKVPALVTRLWVFSVLVFAGALPVLAQDTPKVGVTIGYTTLRVSTNPCTGCAWNWYQFGFNLDGAVPVSDKWQAIVEFGYARHPFREDPLLHSGGLNAINAGAGLRWSGSNPSTAPFAQLVAGLHRDSYNGPKGLGLLTFTGPGIPANSFMVQPGAGVVIPLKPGWGIVGQVDYRRVFAEDPINAVRVVLGFRVTHK